jgi:hypothetical protein
MPTPADDLATLRKCLTRLRYLADHRVGRISQIEMENAVALALEGFEAADRLEGMPLKEMYDGVQVAGAEVSE